MAKRLVMNAVVELGTRYGVTEERNGVGLDHPQGVLREYRRLISGVRLDYGRKGRVEMVEDG